MSKILSRLRQLGPDREHVRVNFETLRDGSLVYIKRFKPIDDMGKGMPFAEYWPERENSLLTRLQEAEAQHVVRVDGVSRTQNEIRTYDAGISLCNLLQFAITFDDKRGTVAHPFFDVGELLKLLRGVMVALDEIHRLGVVHADLSAGNICVKVEEDADDCCHIDYSQIRLIDFAFSLSRDLPLKYPPPIDTENPKAGYMAPFYLEALRRDFLAAQANGRHGGSENVENVMDPCLDYYSLGILAQSLLEDGARSRKGISLAQVEDIICSLKYVGSGKRKRLGYWVGRVGGLPGERILRRINQLLAKAGDDSMISPQFQISEEYHRDTLRGWRGSTPMKAEITPALTSLNARPEQGDAADIVISHQEKKEPSPVVARDLDVSTARVPFYRDWVPTSSSLKKRPVYFALAIFLVLSGVMVFRPWFSSPIVIPVESKGLTVISPENRAALSVSLKPTANEARKTPVSKKGPLPIVEVSAKKEITKKKPKKKTFPEPKVSSLPSVLSADSICRMLDSGEVWPSGFRDLLRRQADNMTLAKDVVREYRETLAKDYSSQSAPRQRKAWLVLGKLAGFHGGGQFAILAKQELDSYENRTKLLHKELQGLSPNPTLQAKEKRWPEYQFRLNLLADKGDAVAGGNLGVALGSQGKVVPAFPLLLKAANSKEKVLQKQGVYYLGKLMRDAEKDPAMARALVPELQKIVKNNGEPNWQLWLARYYETLGELDSARSQYKRLATEENREISSVAGAALKRLEN